MTSFYLMRHGEPNWALAAERKLIGHGADMVPLTATGTSEVNVRVPEISGYGIEQIISSPMTRALETAQLVSHALQLPIQVEFDLHEWVPDRSCTWSSADEVGSLYHDYISCHGKHPTADERPWETREHLRARALAVLERYTHLENALITCHCVLIEALTGEMLQHADIIKLEI